jgi:HSP20 family protein
MGTTPGSGERSRLADLPTSTDVDISPGALFAPRMDVTRRHGYLVVRADLPGLDAVSVRIVVENRTLIIHGERRPPSDEQRSNDPWHTERTFRFRRSVELPDGVDPSSAEARLADDLLEITLRATDPVGAST